MTGSCSRSQRLRYVPDLRGTVHGKNAVAKLVRPWFGDRAAQISGKFGDDLCLAERKIAATAVARLAVTQLAAVAELNRQLAGIVARKLRARIDRIVDAAGERQGLRIGERLIAQLRQAEAAVPQRARDDIGDRELRVIGVGGPALARLGLAHGLHDLGRNERPDPLHAAKIERMIPPERDRRIGAGMGEVASGERFDRHIQQLPTLAELSRRRSESGDIEPLLKMACIEAEEA